MKVITRFPPSPTGLFHIGSARTALFNYLYAKHSGGEMYLRFEDTDRARSNKEFEDDILEGLKWLGISYTLPPVYRQSEKTDHYRQQMQRLMHEGRAYEAEEATDNSGRKVVRFKNPNTTVTFEDSIRGTLKFDTKELGDFVIARNIDEPLYHLAVVVDDHDLGVTHVIRGEDHISNTQRQILILEALGFERPTYAHIPLILAPDRSKLSKRHGAVSVNEYRKRGYEAAAFVNYLALLGWNPGTEQELFSLDELVTSFSLDHVHKSGAVFDTEKLRWFNKQYLSAMNIEEFRRRTHAFLKAAVEARGLPWDEHIGNALIPILRERMFLWSDIEELVKDGELDLFFYDPQPAPADIPQKGTGVGDTSKHLQYVHDTFSSAPVDAFTDPAKIKELIWEYATINGRGQVLWPLRFALSGRAKSPDPFLISAIIGKDASQRRIRAAIRSLEMS